MYVTNQTHRDSKRLLCIFSYIVQIIIFLTVNFFMQKTSHYSRRCFCSVFVTRITSSWHYSAVFIRITEALTFSRNLEETDDKLHSRSTCWILTSPRVKVWYTPTRFNRVLQNLIWIQMLLYTTVKQVVFQILTDFNTTMSCFRIFYSQMIHFSIASRERYSQGICWKNSNL